MEEQTHTQASSHFHHQKLNPFDALAIFEATPDPYLILKPDLTIIAVNDAYLDATFTEREQLNGRGIFDAFPDNPNDPKANGVTNLRNSLKQVIKTKQADRMPLQKYDISIAGGKDFEERYWSPLNTPVLNHQGEVIYIIHHVEDVTEMVREKRHSAELEASEARFRQIANAMPQQVWTLLPDGNVNWCNDWWYTYTGISRDSNKIEWKNHIHPDDRESYYRIREAKINKKNYYSKEIRISDSSGTYRWHLATIRPVKDESGNLIEWVGIAIDIHELTLAKEKIQEDEARFRAITNAVPQIVWSTRADGYHDYFNERYYEFTGATPGSMYGDEWIIFHHPDEWDRLKKTWAHSLDTGEPYEIEYRMRHHTGEWRWVLGRALPVKNTKGEIIRWFGTCTDIHEQIQTQKELNEAIKDRELFFSIASHELKSPLTALSLQTQFQLRKLQMGGMKVMSEEGIKGVMEKIYNQSKKLVGLVDEMLDISRITSGKLTLEPVPCNLCEILREVINRVEPEFQKANIPLPKLNKCQEAQGNWDPMKIEQVITNLLTNALRYGDGKSINVSLESDASTVRFSVEDHGIGISADSKEKIFDRFERATKTSKNQGLGLGLFISKEFVLAHGGKIWVESELGKGSTFTVELPKN